MSEGPSGNALAHIAEIENESIELRLLTEAIYLKYGYDFRGYAKASLKRRVTGFMKKAGVDNIAALQHRLLQDSATFDALLHELSVAVTEMFRDPTFYLALVEKVFPTLDPKGHNKVWLAGCASGEEAYSVAILLRESGLYERTKIFATDINEELLRRAREGVLPVAAMTESTAAYQRAGGKRPFIDYYVARYNSVLLDKSLRDNVVFAHHNLATDGVFGEFDLVLCRNVLIYFGRELQDRAFGLFSDSLRAGGFLALGSHESIRFSSRAQDFDEAVPEHRIYRRRPGAGR